MLFFFFMLLPSSINISFKFQDQQTNQDILLKKKKKKKASLKYCVSTLISDLDQISVVSVPQLSFYLPTPFIQTLIGLL